MATPNSDVYTRRLRKAIRANRRKTTYIVILLVVIIVLLGVIGTSMILQYKKSKEPKTQYVSVTEEASGRAYEWLNKIENIDLKYEDIKSLMGDIDLEVIKTPTNEKGVYDISFSDGTYENCQLQVQVGLEKAYKQAIKNRINNSEYEGTVSDETVEGLMQETFGMSVSEYLKQCNISLLPDKEKMILEIKDKYSKEVTDEKN